MSAILEEALKRGGPFAYMVMFFAAGVMVVYGTGLADGPASAKDLMVVEERVESLEDTDAHVRDDLEKIRTEQAVQGERIENIDEKLDRVLDLLSRR